jgi:hypothetical protein
LFGVAGALSDPKMEIIRTGNAVPLAVNDDWPVIVTLQNAFAAVGAFPLPATGSKDAAVLTSIDTISRFNHTVRISAAGAATAGVALAEVYDVEPLTAPVRLINVSTRGFAGAGAEVLTPGFYIGGNAPKLVLIRVVGPGLTQFGVPDVLLDPQLTVFPQGQSFSIASNNDWGDGGQFDAMANAFAAAGAFELPAGSKDAALIVRLPPGGYTAQASGSGNSTGTALVEVYDLDP